MTNSSCIKYSSQGRQHFAHGQSMLLRVFNDFKSTLLCVILLLHLNSSEDGKKSMVYCNHFFTRKRKHTHDPNQTQA